MIVVERRPAVRRRNLTGRGGHWQLLRRCLLSGNGRNWSRAHRLLWNLLRHWRLAIRVRLMRRIRLTRWNIRLVRIRRHLPLRVARSWIRRVGHRGSVSRRRVLPSRRRLLSWILRVLRARRMLIRLRILRRAGYRMVVGTGRCLIRLVGRRRAVDRRIARLIRLILWRISCKHRR